MGRKFSFPLQNEIVFPPKLDEATGELLRRPAYVCHMRANVKYSGKKLWYLSSFIRGMTVDEAIRQLAFVKNLRKGGLILTEVLQEAREMATKEHSVEHASDLWVAESFFARGAVVKGFRRFSRGKMATVEYNYSDYFVKLEEGRPPKDYYEWRRNRSPEEMLQNYIEDHRRKNIPLS